MEDIERREQEMAREEPSPEGAAGEIPGRGNGRRRNSSRSAAKETGEAANGDAPDLPISWSFRGFLITYILLLLSFQRAHGYFIEQYLRGLGLANVEMSSLYRTLRQLEGAGLVSSTWEHNSEGPARRVYSLTDSGRWWLDANANVLQGYRTLIDRFFGSYLRTDRPSDNNR